MSWKDDPWVLVDLETTGKDPETAAVCQIGWRVFRNGEPCEGEEHLVNPGESIPAEATAIHGIADGDVANAPTLEEVWPLLQAALADAAGQILWRWRDRLPDDGAEAQRWLRAQKKRQDDRYNEWKASQPKDPQ